MSTKKTTDTTNKYDPASMSTFQAFQPVINQGLTDYAKDPLKSTFFNTRVQLGLNQSRLLNQRGISNILNNQVASGFGGGGTPGFTQSMLAAQARGNSANESNVFNTNLLAAESARQWALGNMANYKPLQTGQHTEEKTSGLGTWLPQVLGTAAQVGMGFATGGASLGLGGIQKAMNKASFDNPFQTMNSLGLNASNPMMNLQPGLPPPTSSQGYTFGRGY